MKLQFKMDRGKGIRTAVSWNQKPVFSDPGTFGQAVVVLYSCWLDQDIAK